MKLTDRTYLMSTFLSILLIIAATVGSAYLSTHKNVLTVAASKSEAVNIAEEASRLSAHYPTALFPSLEIIRVADREEAEHLLRDHAADAALLPNTDPESPHAWDLIAWGQPDPQLLSALNVAVHERALSRLVRLGNEDVSAVERSVSVRPLALKSDAEYGFYRWIIGLVFAILFYFSSMTYGVQIAQSVLEEKQSRIVEIIVSAIPVRQLLIGKVVGNTVIAILHMLLLTGCGVICGLFTPARDFLPSLGGAIGWFIVMFLAGFFTLSGLWAAAGALCTRSEDLQYSAQPIMLALSGVFIVGATVSGTARTVLSYCPVLSTILMPTRLLDAEASWVDAVAAFGISLVCAFGAITLGDRIYRRAILHTGRRLGYREMLSSRTEETAG